MKRSKFGVVTLLLALCFVASLGLTVWAWTSYAAHDGSLEQAGDAIAGVIFAMSTVGLGVPLWFRFEKEKDQEPKDFGKHAQ